MKKLSYLLACLFVLSFMAACNEKEEHNEAYYASVASISSDSQDFTATDNGGTISFSTEGGTVVVNVDCGVDWTAENHSEDVFSAVSNLVAGTLTVSAGQNTVEENRTTTIVLMTAASGIQFATLNVTQNAYGAPEISVESNSWNAPAVGALTVELAVEASDDWTAESGADWITAANTGSAVSLTVEENTETDGRSGEVTLSCTDGIRTTTTTVTVTQDGKAYVSLNKETAAFFSEAETAEIIVESNFDWDISYDTSAGWFTASKDGSNIDITVSANESGDTREGSITVTAGDGAENVAEALITVTQSDLSENTLVLVYTISSAGTQVKLPLYDSVNCTVDWGDGNTQTVTSNSPTHTYDNEGTYNVCIDGTVTRLNSLTGFTTAQKANLTAVRQWGHTGLTSMDHAFYACANLASIPETTGDSFKDVTTFTYAFYGTVIDSVPEDLFADCAAATDFSYVFQNCTALESIPEGIFDNVPEATTFYNALGGSGIKTVPGKLFVKCPKVTTLGRLFYQCASLESVPADLFEGCSNVTVFDWLFRQCSSLAEIPEGLFDPCSAADSFDHGFYQCTSLTSLPKNLFANCVSATDFEYIFGGCTALTTVDGSIFKNCSKVEDFTYAFNGCSALTAIPEGLFDDCTAVDQFNSAFYSCKAITEIPAGLFANCPNVEYFTSTFANCTALTKVPDGLFDKNTEVYSFMDVFQYDSAITYIPVGLFSNCKKVALFTWAFQNCSDWEGESPYDEFEIDGKTVKVHLYERLNDEYKSYYPDVTAITSVQCFSGCTKLTDYYDIPSAWGGGGE